MHGDSPGLFRPAGPSLAGPGVCGEKTGDDLEITGTLREASRRAFAPGLQRLPPQMRAPGMVRLRRCSVVGIRIPLRSPAPVRGNATRFRPTWTTAETDM